MDSTELANALRTESTSEMLSSIMKNSAILAGNIESAVGILPTALPLNPSKRSGWHISEAGLLRDDIESIRAEMVAAPDPKKGIGECPVSKAKMTSAIFGSIVKICETDENLFERSLSA